MKFSLKEKFKMLKNIPYATTIEMMLTRKCNMNCKYCFEKDKKGKNLNLDETYRLITGNNYTLPVNSFYMFGGEPLLNLKFITDLIDKIQKDNTLSTEKKEKWIREMTHNLTTNGTLINKNIKLLKDYGFSLQVSLDGPEEINDLCRVDHANKGKFELIQNNLKLCREEGIPYNLHGAVSHVNYKNFDKINEFFLEEMIKAVSAQAERNKNKKELEDFLPVILFHNYCQFVFEEDITDSDIDALLEAYQRTIEFIFSTSLLNDYDFNMRKLVAEGFLARRGGMCSAGNNMFAIDDDFFVYPCHRWMTSGLDRDHLLSLDGLKSPRIQGTNYSQYEQLISLPLSKIMYGELYDNDISNSLNCQFQANWCPSTNYEITKNVWVWPAHYSMLIAELQNFIPRIAEYYHLDIQGYLKKYLSTR